MRTNKSIIMVLAIASIVSLSIAAHADWKNYPASMCVKVSGPTPSYSSSNIYNPSTTTTMHVDCPAVKDTDASIAGAWMKVKDRNSSMAVECTFVSAYVSGSTVYYWSTSEASTTSSSWTTLEFSGLSENDSGYYYIGCSVPPKESYMSGIGPYRVNENN